MADGPYRPNIPHNASAVLIWLPKGIDPSAPSFDIKSVNAPPVPNPEPWWECRQAINHAASLIHHDGKVPWIKVGDLLLSPEEIAEVVANRKKP